VSEGLLKMAGRWKQEMSPELQKLYDQIVGLKNRGVDPVKLTGQVHQFPSGFKKLVADRIFGAPSDPLLEPLEDRLRRFNARPKVPPTATSTSSPIKWPLLALGGLAALGGVGLLAIKMKERANEKKLQEIAA
jgi:hypothetical protein